MKVLYSLTIISLLALFTNKDFAQNYWNSTYGPLLDSNFVYASVYSLTINSYDFIYAGTNKGVYLTTDYGSSWEKRSNGLNDYLFTSLAVNSDNTIFAGSEHNGIYKSTDNGDTWINSGLNGNYYITSVVVDTNDNIFVGSWGMGEGGIFRSTDNGASWTQNNQGLTTTNIFSFVVNSNNDLFAGASSNIFKSTDNGNFWTSINDGTITSDVSSIGINSKNYIFAGTLNGIYRSTNYGLTWEEINNGLTTSIILSLAINSDDIIFVGTNQGGAFYSTDDGDSWNEINSGLTDLNVFSLAFDSYGSIYAGTLSGGVFKSRKSTLLKNYLPLHMGNIWQYIEKTATADGDRYTIAYDSVSHDTLINNVKYYKLNNFNDFIRFSKIEGKIFIRWNDSDYIYVDFNVPPGGTYQSFRAGHYFITVTAVAGGQNIFNHYYDLGGFEYYGSDVYKTYFCDSIGMTTNFIGLEYGPIYFYNYDLIEAIIYDSTNTPNNFSYHYKPEFNLIPITHIDTCNFNLNFKVMHHYTHLPPGGGPPWITGLDFIDSVWMYSYYSKSDSIIQEPVFYPSRPSVSNFTINKQVDTVLLKDGFTFNYKFKAKDKGIIPEYTTSPDSGYYQCIWNFPNSIKLKPDNRFHYSLLQNYPNPFNPTTKIKYQLPELSNVKLIVYDVLGREIKTLVKEEKPAGSYEVEFDGTGLPSGIYFYRIETGKFSDTKKLILMK